MKVLLAEDGIAVSQHKMMGQLLPPTSVGWQPTNKVAIEEKFRDVSCHSCLYRHTAERELILD